MRAPSKIIVVIVLLAIHLAIDLSLIFISIDRHPSAWSCNFTVLICMSQISILAIWLAFSGIRYYAVYLILLISVVFLWLIEIKSINLDPIYDSLALACAVMLIQQSLLIVLIALFFKITHWMAQNWRGDPTVQNNDYLQFGIGSILMWIFAAALTLGMIKWAIMKFYWSSNNLLDALRIISSALLYIIYNTVFALIIYWAVSRPSKYYWRIAVSLLGILGIVLLHNGIFNRGNLSMSLLDINSYSMIILATLLPLRWCGLLGANGIIHSEGTTVNCQRA
jgi:hypothetical protein